MLARRPYIKKIDTHRRVNNHTPTSTHSYSQTHTHVIYTYLQTYITHTFTLPYKRAHTSTHPYHLLPFPNSYTYINMFTLINKYNAY